MEKRMVWVCLLIICVFGFSQEPVSVSGDKQIEDLIARVEGDRKEPVLENLFKPRTDTETLVSSRAEAYYTALMKQTYNQAYQMMTQDYQKWVKPASYLKKSRLDLSRVQIKSIVMEGERCARIQGYIWGSHSGLGSELRIPVREYIVLEEGEWRIYQHPFSNAAGVMPPMARNIRKPCDY